MKLTCWLLVGHGNQREEQMESYMATRGSQSGMGNQMDKLKDITWKPGGLGTKCKRFKFNPKPKVNGCNQWMKAWKRRKATIGLGSRF